MDSGQNYGQKAYVRVLPYKIYDNTRTPNFNFGEGGHKVYWQYGYNESDTTRCLANPGIAFLLRRPAPIARVLQQVSSGQTIAFFVFISSTFFGSPFIPSTTFFLHNLGVLCV